MIVNLDNIGKRYNTDWIFRNASIQLNAGDSYVILGSNGSGKSTLLQVIAGNISPTEGKITYQRDQTIAQDKVYQYLSYASPYLELIEEFTLEELIDFQFSFKAFTAGIDKEKFIQITELEKSREKQIKYYSSGMKQRVKLALALLTSSEIILLDEPCINLDQTAKDWYGKLVEKHAESKLVVVCSNHQQEEYYFCKNKIEIDTLKSKI